MTHKSYHRLTITNSGPFSHENRIAGASLVRIIVMEVPILPDIRICRDVNTDIQTIVDELGSGIKGLIVSWNDLQGSQYNRRMSPYIAITLSACLAHRVDCIQDSIIGDEPIVIICIRDFVGKTSGQLAADEAIRFAAIALDHVRTEVLLARDIAESAAVVFMML